MTIGELSNLFNEEIGSLLDVVPMTGWHRDLLWADTGLPWTPPSPNLPTVASAVVYGATVFLEATTVSEGRGTTTPFELFGAPFLSAQVKHSTRRPYCLLHRGCVVLMPGCLLSRLCLEMSGLLM